MSNIVENIDLIATFVAIVGLIFTCIQFSKTMKAQEKAINISLLDLRMEILECVEDGRFDFKRTRAQVLFNDDITKKIGEYDSNISEYKRCQGLRDEFLDVVKKGISDDTYEEITEFLEDIQKYDTISPDDAQYLELRRYLQENSYTGKWMYGKSFESYETINYVDVSEQEMLFHDKVGEIKNEIAVAMKTYIKNSI